MTEPGKNNGERAAEPSVSDSSLFGRTGAADNAAPPAVKTTVTEPRQRAPKPPEEREVMRQHGLRNPNKARAVSITDIAEFFEENAGKPLQVIGITRLVSEAGAPAAAIDEVSPAQLSLEWLRGKHGGGMYRLTPRDGAKRFCGAQCEILIAGPARNPFEVAPAAAPVHQPPAPSSGSGDGVMVQFLLSQITAKDQQIARLQDELLKRAAPADSGLKPADLLALVSGGEDIRDRRADRVARAEDRTLAQQRASDSRDAEIRTLRAQLAQATAGQRPSAPPAQPFTLVPPVAQPPLTETVAGLPFVLSRHTYDYLGTLTADALVAETDRLGIDGEHYTALVARLNADFPEADAGDSSAADPETEGETDGEETADAGRST